ncbi:MAG: PAS domain S-box protein [Bacteroidia bacterium]
MEKTISLLNCISNKPVILFDADGLICWQNEGANMYGFDATQRIAQNIWQKVLTQIDKEGKWQGALDIKLKEPNSLVNKDCCLTKIILDAGERFALVVNDDDHLESEEKKLLNRLKMISENSSTITTLYSKNGVVEYISPQAERILGYSITELENNSAHFGIQEEYIQRFNEYFQKTLKGYKHEDGLEVAFIRKNDTSIWLKIRMTPIYNHQGEISNVQATTNNITRRKLAEEQLRNSEQNARAIINSSDSAILLLTKDYKIITANDKAKMIGHELFNSSLSEGQSIVNIIPRVHVKIFTELFNKASNGTTSRSYRHLTFSNKRKYWFIFKYTPIWESDGTVSAVAWTATDVTDQKRSEDYTAKLLERLSLANSAGQIGIWEYDFKSMVIKFDDQCLNLYDKHIGVNEHLPKWAKLYTVNSRAKILATFGNKDLSGVKNFDHELQLNSVLGNNEFHKVKGIISYSKGKPKTATGVIIDFTKTKVAERNLEASRDKLLQAQKLAKMGDFEYEVAKKKVTWGENNYKLHGIGTSQIPSLLQYVKHIRQNERFDFVEAIRRASISNSTQKLLIHFGKHVFSYTIKGIFYRNKLTKIVGTVQDITDNITIQKNLEQKEKQISANKKLISEYSFVNSHKVRAPLSNILGLIQLIKLEHNEELLEMLEKSADELDHVIHEVNSLLAE